MKKHDFDRAFVFILALLSAAGGVALCLFPAARFSATENRMLAEFPAFSLREAASGEWEQNFDLYATERFPARRVMRGGYALLSLSIGMREARGVILCRDGSLIRRPAPDDAVFARNLAWISRLRARAESHALPFTLAVAPRRIEACPDLLPFGYDVSRERAVWETLAARTEALTFDTLSDPACFYRTDHHWTSEGAFRAARALVSVLPELADTVRERPPFERFCDDFYGTSEGTAGIPAVAPDTLFLPLLPREDFLVTRDGVPAAFEGFYDRDKRAERDRYAVFFGGNCGVLEITERETTDTRPVLLLFRDSFASSLLPYLAEDYHVVAVDPRYTAPDFDALLSRADRVLCLFSMQTLTETAIG